MQKRKKQRQMLLLPSQYHIKKLREQCSKKGVTDDSFIQRLIGQLILHNENDNWEKRSILTEFYPEIGTPSEFTEKSLLKAIMLCVLKKMYSDCNSSKGYHNCFETEDYVNTKIPITVCRYDRCIGKYVYNQKVKDFEEKTGIKYNALRRYKFERITMQQSLDKFYTKWNGILYEPLIGRYFYNKNFVCPKCKKTKSFIHCDGSWKDFKCINCNCCIEVKTVSTQKITESLQKNKFIGGACKYLWENFYNRWDSFILFINRDNGELHLKKIFRYNPIIVKETLASGEEHEAGTGHLKAEVQFDKRFEWRIEKESKILGEKMLPKEQLDILLTLCKKHILETRGNKPNDFSDIEEEFNQRCNKFYKQRHRDNMCRVFEDLDTKYIPQ